MRVLIFGGTGGLGSLSTEILKRNGHDVRALSSEDVDVRNADEVENVVREYQPEAVLNLAVYNSDASIHKLENEEVKQQIDINISGAVNVMRSSVAFMREKSFGRIIFLSSVLSTNPVFGTSIYAAGKGFVDNLIKTAAIENCSKGITVNSIQLGYFEAGLINQVPDDMLKTIVDKIPLKRLGTAEELCQTIEFMFTTEYLTGVNLPLQGGLNLSTF